ncbi:MAG: HEAT repeat domain-containing protein [Arcicella sp.]|nr:HEAT repeat domain-containing protein [Arcicella sp.]
MFNIFLGREKKLEKARIKLISDLEVGSIDFLISQMTNHEVYSPLLEKKQKRESTWSSTDYITWYAYERARELSSENDKKKLLLKLNSESDSSIKNHIYYCLSHICANSTDSKLFNFLMEKLEIEDNEECKVSILFGLRNMIKDLSCNLEPLKKMIHTKSIALKRMSISALSHVNDKDVEDLLLDIFKNKKDNHIRATVCFPLESVGTKKAIPVLNEVYKKTRDFGLRNDIERVIAFIKERENG